MGIMPAELYVQSVGKTGEGGTPAGENDIACEDAAHIGVAGAESLGDETGDGSRDGGVCFLWFERSMI